MKNMLRRNLALLLAVVMILSCTPLDGMAAVIGASQLFDQFADQLATDYSGGASIARIVQPPAAVDTYVFKVDDEPPISTQKVKKGDVLYEPAAPSKDGYKFTGWRDAAGNAPVFGPVTAEATGETYTYTAQFDQVYYVFFMDDQGRVQITREGTAGDKISTQVTIKLQNAQTAVTGWYYDAALTQPVQEGHVTLSGANITLWPKVEEGYYLTFETNGGTYYPPAFYMPGKPTVDPGVPQKAGYSFTGWKDETGASFAFGSALTADKTLTAQWQANQNTQYTVIHWMENANDDGYSFKESEEKTGTTGAQTAAAAKSYEGFTAQTITQTAIAADGSTIVSVYYKRDVYEVKFYRANSSSEYTALRITAKYGAYIGDKWPTYNGSNTWSTKKNGSGPYQVNIDTMPLNGAKFYGPKTGYDSETAYYYVEVLPGETGTDAVGGKSYKLHHSDTSPGTGYTVTVEDQYPITGYTFNASVSTKTGGRYNNAKFYYTRNSYDIIYMNGGSEVTSYRTSVLFEQTITDAANKPAPTPPMGKENYTFKGWYDDPAGQMLHAFSGKMPAQNITVYAKWAPPTVSGTAFITMAGNGSAPITIAYGGTINPDDLPTPTAPEGEGWEFVAWATKAGDVYTPFNFDTKIYENIELYPYYVNKNQYQVTYHPGEGTGAVEDTRRYASGAEADVKAAAGLTPPAGKVFVGWKVESTGEIKQPGDKLTITGNMTLTAQWGDAPAAVTLTYYGNGGKTADGQTSTSVTHENNATISTLGSTAFTRRGYTLTGWNTQANGQGDPFNCGASVLIDSHGDNALYAVWALDAEQTVTVTYASEDAQKGTVSHTEDTIQIVSGEPVTGSTAAANPGYTFVGWYKGEALISSEAALTAATAKASLNKDADGLYADTTYIARFAKRTDLSYTVHYYWNGTATPVAESKTVDGQTYGASATESPAAVDGCTPVSTASQTITIGAETNKIIFYYYKNVELTAESKTVAYNGNKHTVSGFNGAPEEANFDAIKVGAEGTNAGTYPAAFPEGTEGTVDATRKYIVTKATDGALTITKKAVIVNVTGRHTTHVYDGKAHTAEGFDTDAPAGVTVTLAKGETAYAQRTDAGTTNMGLNQDSFVVTSDNYDVTIGTVTDGYVTITPVTDKVIVTITENSDTVTYDGQPHIVRGYKTISSNNALYNVNIASNVAAQETAAWTATGTDVGEYPVGIEAKDFKNINDNFTNVEFVIVDGVLKIDPVTAKVTVTVTEKSGNATYDGTEHTLTGYKTMVSDNELYNVKTSVQETATAAWTARGTNAGEYPVGVKAEDFENTNKNFTNVEFVIVDGLLKIDPVATKVTVTVTEKSGTVTYDGTEHTVTGYESITADNTLYNVKASVQETPTAAWTAKGTNAGEYPVGVKAGDFKNINENFTNVEFKIVDGLLKIDPVKAEVTVTIVGNHATVLYNAREHTVQGYTATSSNPLFNVDTDFTYGQDGPSGEAAKAKAKATGVNVKRHEMGLQSRDFVTVSQNFQHVTYAVTDGYLDIEKRPVVVEVANSDKVYGEADPAFANATLRFYEGQQIITPNEEMQAELAGIDLTVHRTDAGNDTVGTHEDVLVISKTAEELRVQYPNYLIGVNPGDFEITATAESLIVRAKDYENAYDGKAHGVVAKAYINKNEEAGAAQIKYWNEATGAYDLDESPAYTNVKSATPGDRVYTVRFQATLDGLTAEGSANVLIAPQELVFTSNSASRGYTGQPLTSPDVTLSSGRIINGEIHDYKATGTVTNAYDGVVTNTIVYSTTAAFKPVNYEIELKEGQLDINPREVKLTSQTKSKEYDGTPLTMPQVTIGPNDFVEGEVTDIRATGSVTYVTDGPNHDGKAPNTIEYTPAGKFDARNYRIEKNEGVLSITRRTGTMVIETLSDSKVYDGSALYCPNQTLHGSLADGDRLVVSNYVSDLVNVGSKFNTFESFCVKNEAGQDTTANYTFGEPIYGTLEITARPLTITVADNTVTYDGQPHGKADPAYTVNQAAVDAAGKDNGVGLVNPAVGDKTQTHTLTGTDIAFTAVNAGTYENQLNMVKDNVKILSGNQDVTGNYAITILPGTLTISQRPVTFTGETATKVYNGEAQSITAIAQSGLVEGHTLTGLTYAATGTDVGEYPGAFKDEAKIMNGTEDVTANYAITKKEGQLTITAVTDKVIVTVTEKSGTVTYDGQAHSVHGYATMSSNNALYNENIASNVAAQETAAWTATGTDAGEYPVGIEAKDFKNISQNFTTVEFEIVDGSLIINPITEKTITITAASEEKAYDGTALTNGRYTYTQGVLVNGDVLTATVEGSQTDAGSSANRVTGYKVMHGETDVTKNYTFAQSKDGTLTVKPVAIELTANSAEKIYDGTPLTDNGYQITKGAFVGEEGLASVTVEGSQTLVGTSANEIRAHGLKANTKAQNYAITYQPGQLTVKDRNEKYRLTVEANSGSKVYDGTALKVEGLKQLIFTVNEQTFTVSGLTAEKTATNVSESGAVAVRGTAIVKDAAGNDVTAQFDVQTVPGTLTISQRPVTITANNLEYDYNYESPVAHPAQGVERYSVNEGLLDGDTVTAEVRYDGRDQQTLIGAYDAVVQEGVAIKSGEADVTANYAITLLPGLLKIKGDKIAPDKTTPQQVESNYKLGDTIPFTITVKNVSTAIVENIIVEDPNAILVAGQGYSVSEDGHTATIPSLAPDAQVEIQAQHVVTEADILAGTVGNTATVAWENTTRTVEAKTEEIEEPSGALGVTKETTSTPKNGKTYALGETITYKITVTNTGNLTAKNIQVTDSLSTAAGKVIATIDSLAPGASQEIPFEYVVTEQDILNGKVVNEAAAKGETDDPDKKPEGGDKEENETDDIDTTLEVVKVSGQQEGQLAGLGETIEYTITVTNKGNVAYRNVKVDDELTGLHETIAELGVGKSESFTTTYTVTEEDVLNGHVLNEATAAADPIHNPKTGEDEIPEGSDEVTDETVAAEGALGVTKETTSTPKNGKTYALGETITYKITVTNTGNLTAKNIQVTDSLSAKEGQVIATIDSLAPGASQEIPFAYVVTEQDILNGKVVNEAAAKGETDDPDKKPEGGDEKEDETDDVDATLEVVKTSNKQEGQKAKLGEAIEYTITVTNKGNVAYRNVKVDDELTGLHETIDELGVGASESFTTTYTVTEEDILKGHVRNVATAEGDKVPDPKNPDDPKKPAGEDEQDDPTDEPDASLTVVKSLTNRPNKGYFTLGETAEFDVVVTNTGNVTLKNIRLTEMLEGAEFVTGEGYTVKNGQAVIEELKPGQEDGDGQSVTVKATYTIQTKDLGMGVLKNIVAGEGEGPGKNPDDEGGTEFDVDYAKQVNAVKVWEDEENKHETRPAAITFVLMDESTGEELDRKDATAANEWSVSFDNLPAHDADGNEIIYGLKEIEVTGYDTRYGGPVEPTVAPPVIQGAPETDKGGEQIPGDAEQDEPVERDVHKIDQTIINTLRSHKLTIRYWVEVVGGQKAFDTYEKEYYYNEQYSVVSPGMYGYEPDLPRVQGRMPDEDLEIDVVYVRQIYKLTIYYIFEDGTTAHKEYEAKLYADEKFEVESPEINGYKPNLWMISGVMPDRNLNYTVIYIARTKPVEIQEAVAPLGVGSVVPNTGDCFD